MADECPVCGDPYEYDHDEPVEETGVADGLGITHELDDLCSAAAGTRWNRICHRVTASVEGGDARPVVETYRHHWESTGNGRP